MKSIKELRGASPKLGKIKSLRHAGDQPAPGKICRASGGSVIDSGNDEMGGGFSKGPTSKPSKMKGGGKFGKKAGSKIDKPGKDKAAVNIAIMVGGPKPGGIGSDTVAGGLPPGPPGPPPGPPPGAGGPPPGGPPGMPPKPPGPPMMRAKGGRVNMPKMAGHSRAKP